MEQWLTGGIGNVLFILIGVLLIAAAIFFFASGSKVVETVSQVAKAA